LMITPLFWNFKRGADRHSVLFPIVWYNKDVKGSGTEESFTFLPFYRSYRDEKTRNNVLFPIIWSFQNPDYKSYTFFPMFSGGRSTDSTHKHLVVTPFIWHLQNKETRRNIIFPLYWNTKMGTGINARQTGVLFPIYWSSHNATDDTKVLFPVVWSYKNAKRKAFTLFPLLSVSKSMDSTKSLVMLTPLFWHTKTLDTKRNVLFPIFWQTRETFAEKDAVKTRLLPLYWSFHNQYRNNKVLLPFFYSMKNPDYKSFTFAPLWSSGRNPDGSRKHLMLTPLFWHFKRPEGAKTTLVPLFYHSRKNEYVKFNIAYFVSRYKADKQKKSFDLLFPICNYTRTDNSVSFRIVPVIWYKKSPEIRYFSIQPIYYQGKTSEANSYNILWQLFTYQNEFNYRKSRNFLLKTVFWDTYANGDHEFRFVYLLIANVNKDGNIERSFFPFYHRTQGANGDKSLSLFLYFYHYFKRKLPDSDEYYMEERIFWFIRLRSNYKKLLEEGKLKK